MVFVDVFFRGLRSHDETFWGGLYTHRLQTPIMKNDFELLEKELKRPWNFQQLGMKTAAGRAFGSGLLQQLHKSQVGIELSAGMFPAHVIWARQWLCDRIGEISHDFLKTLESSNWFDVLRICCWESFREGIPPERMKSLRPTLPETNSQSP